jgi:excisionase family DNA binding protein
MHSINEAATMLGLAPATLRAQARNKKLRAVKLGRDWFMTSEEIERYRREHRRQEAAS